MEERRARIAVIGTGWWSTFTHIPGLLDDPAADLVAICDADGERLRAAAARFGIARTYTDVGEMLRREQLDGAVIAVNHTAHYAVARDCLDAGLHIMLEKPMVLQAAHARDLLERAHASGVEIIVGYPWHYTDIARRARAAVQSGALGQIQFVASLYASMVVEFYRGNPEAYRSVFHYPVTGPTARSYADASLAGGGQGHLQVTHSAGLLFWVTGLRAARVSAFMERFDVAVDLVDAISIRFAGGAVGVVGSTGNIGVGDRGQHDLRVYGDRGYLILDMIAGTLAIHAHVGEPEVIGPLSEGDPAPRFATARNLVTVILGLDRNQSPGEIGVRCVELLDAAYQSASLDGQPVRVP